jgi:DNA-binding response OmpR family regulator
MENLIFIVDDDPDDRQIILEAFLENTSQIDCVFFENAQQLLDNMNTDGLALPSLIVLDLNMPGITGLQALREIRHHKKFAQIPVIVLTTSSLKRDRTMSYELGASCFLTKPDSFDKLCDIVSAVIRLWLFVQDPVSR